VGRYWGLWGRSGGGVCVPRNILQTAGANIESSQTFKHFPNITCLTMNLNKVKFISSHTRMKCLKCLTIQYLSRRRSGSDAPTVCKVVGWNEMRYDNILIPFHCLKTPTPHRRRRRWTPPLPTQQQPPIIDSSCTSGTYTPETSYSNFIFRQLYAQKCLKYRRIQYWPPELICQRYEKTPTFASISGCLNVRNSRLTWLVRSRRMLRPSMAWLR